MSDGIELCPHVLLRISSHPFEEFDGLNLFESLKVIRRGRRLQAQLDKLKDRISSALYKIIPALADTRLQNLMLNFRRDMYNERYIPPEKAALLDSCFPETVKEDWRRYRELVEKMQAAHQEGREIFNREVNEARQRLRTLAEGKTLQKGLLLASQSLLERVSSYLERGGQPSKKDYQTEKSLIKYISRMYAKTSPFSTFTNLSLVGVGGGSRVFTFSQDHRFRTRNHIRLNNFLFQYLRGLLTQNAQVARLLLVRPNPTLKQEEEHYVFLTNSNNVEAFQRIPANPVLEVFRVLSSEQKQGITIDGLIRTIMENEYIDAPAEDIEAYIRQLVEYGFLEFNFEVSGIDPDWDIKLCRKLAAVAERIPLVGELLGVLEEIRRLADRYGEAELADRKEILENAFTQFRTICMKLHQAAGLPEEERKSPVERQAMAKKEAGKREAESGKAERDGNGGEAEEVFKHRSNTYFNFKPEQMFYEDTTVDISGEIDEGSLSTFASTLHRLLQKMKGFEGQLDERDKMRYYFEKKYGPDTKVDLVTFYEDYYREFKKPEAREKEKADQPPPPVVPAIAARKKSNKRWMERLTSHLKKKIADSEGEVNIGFNELDRLERENGDGAGNGVVGCSFGAFVQFFLAEQPDGGTKLMGAVNSCFPGFGKMFSRFLHVFDDTVTRDIRRQNESLGSDHLLIEDTDASYFNANLHPPLLPFEIWMPSGHNSLPPEGQIPITELQVTMDKAAAEIRLIHQPSQKRAFVFDLGFQGHMGRSQLFQLLEKFSLARYLFYTPVINAVNSAGRADVSPEKIAEGKIWSQPRIVYENCLVLQRRAWYVPRVKLPFRQAGEDDWSYFYRLNGWREALGIPDEIFIFLFNRWDRENIKPEEQKRIGRDDYKPQYISFRNPFLVSLFEKSLNKVPRTLRIVEMLPDSRQLLKIGGNRHIMEFLVQWACQEDIIPGGTVGQKRAK